MVRNSPRMAIVFNCVVASSNPSGGNENVGGHIQKAESAIR